MTKDNALLFREALKKIQWLHSASEENVHFCPLDRSLAHIAKVGSVSGPSCGWSDSLQVKAKPIITQQGAATLRRSKKRSHCWLAIGTRRRLFTASSLEGSSHLCIDMMSHAKRYRISTVISCCHQPPCRGDGFQLSGAKQPANLGILPGRKEQKSVLSPSTV